MNWSGEWKRLDPSTTLLTYPASATFADLLSFAVKEIRINKEIVVTAGKHSVERQSPCHDVRLLWTRVTWDRSVTSFPTRTLHGEMSVPVVPRPTVLRVACKGYFIVMVVGVGRPWCDRASEGRSCGPKGRSLELDEGEGL